MDSTRPPLEAFAADARRLFESVTSRLGPDASSGASSLLDRLQLAPRSEVERLRAEILVLEQRLTELESRLTELTAKTSS